MTSDEGRVNSERSVRVREGHAVILKEYPASPATRDLVRAYRVVHFSLEAKHAPAVKVYPPTPEHCLQFFGRGRETVEYPDGRRLQSFDSVITGAHDITVRRIVPADVLLLQVAFQPSALHRIAGLPAGDLHNRYIDAEAVFGPTVKRVTDSIQGAETYGEMIATTDAFIAGLAALRRAPRDIDPALRLLRDDPSVGVERLAASCSLSLRQMERSCRDRTGLGPKAFARLHRFDRAFHGKLQRPELDWLSIAVACGYYDYQHMARDFREFTGLSPSRLLETQSTSPEEILGVRHEFDLSYSVPIDVVSGMKAAR
jgi:AraC-like DNA-binding protein